MLKKGKEMGVVTGFSGIKSPKPNETKWFL